MKKIVVEGWTLVFTTTNKNERGALREQIHIELSHTSTKQLSCEEATVTSHQVQRFVSHCLQRKYKSLLFIDFSPCYCNVRAPSRIHYARSAAQKVWSLSTTCMLATTLRLQEIRLVL
jgi:hypothetical protein